MTGALKSGMGERPRKMEVLLALVEGYTKTFIPRFDIYPLQRDDGQYWQIKKPLAQNIVVAHLTNHYNNLPSVTLGAYALNQNNEAHWICFDADTGEQWGAIWKMTQHLRKIGIPSYPEASRRGGHLWLFTPTLTGTDARKFGNWLLEENQMADMGIELYPKQDRLLEGAGSFVRLPLGVHRKTGKVYYFLNLKGEPLSPTITGQIELLAKPDRVPMEFINHALSQTPDKETPPPTPHFDKQKKAHGETLSEKIKNAMGVFDFVSKYVELDSQGRGHCPFHDDEHQSFQVNQQDNYWSCYAGCGGGSLIDFYAKWRAKNGQSGDFTETITELKDILHIPRPSKKRKRRP